jgi:hypothetical protein
MASADDARMHETPVPETLETIAEKVTALGKSIDQRFAKVDQQFAKVDQQFAETKAQLGVKIEAVDAKVTLVFDAVLSLQKHSDTNVSDHQRFTERLDNHDVRILALEPSKAAKP